MSQNANERIESDSMGKVPIPGWAYWGAQTQRAVQNFSVSEHRIPRPMIRALALIKKNAARTNGDLQTVPSELAVAIEAAADEVLNGKWDEHFPVDVFQTGSGTSWNMNANEVIANRACDILGHPIGKRHPVHPNDHVNRGQSSNDVIPSAIHIANRMEAPGLLDAVRRLGASFRAKAEEFASVVKIGRTHLQDAVPMTLGQEFEAYAVQMKKSVERIERTLPNLEELALGGTAVGTGLNAHPDFAERSIAGIAEETGVPFRAAESRFESIANRDAQVELAGALNSLAVSLMKIANDLRLLAGGPRAGLGEITLPSLQPGSSIMPGKINPVIPEMMIQVAAHVMGKVAAISVGGQNAPLELNMMNPLIAYETLSAISILTESCKAFATRCVDGIVADAERCKYWIEWSLALVTPLANRIGYDKSAELAHIAFEQKRTIRDVVKESGLMSDDEVDELLDPKSMIG
ncbi:MAG: class II fumarate hydratase [Spirochaetales bacterium]|nr:class II fumarate hydratase [Spirochaetales bacterium]